VRIINHQIKQLKSKRNVDNTQTDLVEQISEKEPTVNDVIEGISAS
jgi:hypothetical protein